jgi:hypothetical protein
MALTQDRNTPMRDGELVSAPVAAVKIFAGSLVAINAAGYATPGAVATTLKYFGRAEEQVDNSAGAAGDRSVLVRRGQAFKWLNHGADPVVQADLGANCYIVDDQTVAKTSGGATRSVAGKVIQVDADGIWVE